MRSPRTIRLGLSVPFVFGIAVVLCVGGCGGTAPYTLGTIKTTDPDRQPTPRPDETQESMYWDRIDMSLFHQVEKPLNLNWMGQKLGQVVGGDPDEADNVNVMDEPPNSSWYQRRHFYDEMTPRELAIGPNEHDTTGTAAGPAQNGTWTVTNGKFQGASRGFQIKDPRGDRYLIKLDHPEWPELMSAAEVISTKIFYGAGYHVPQNTVTSFSLDQLKVGDEARVQTAGNKQRPMTREDLRQMLAPYGQGEDEEIRAMASKFVEGKPLGPIFFQGTRDGDKNDRVRHEQRRELRGLRVIGSWLNDVDRRHANSLAVYTDEQYVKHYLIDMGSTLGSRAGGPHRPIDGQVYLIDHRKIPQAVVSLGLYRFPWWDYDAGASYKAVGYFRADVFNPGEWVPTYPNPAFEKMTRRDAYWGAKMVMSFSDEDLKAIVETARISNPAAEDHLIEVLKARRDKVGRYWFDRINPLDRFRVADAYGAGAERSGAGAGGLQLCFDDLAVTGNLEPAEARRYTYRMVVDDEPVGEQQTVERSRLPMAVAGTALGTWLDQRNRTTEDERVVRIDLRTRQANEVSSVTRVYVHVPNDDRARVVGLERL